MLMIALAVALMWFGTAVHADTSSEFIRVSPDGWSFETSETRQRFVPFGGVYYDPATYTDARFPRFLVISQFDEARTDRHFADTAALGANLVRITLSTGSMCPKYGELDPKALATLDKILAQAGKHGLRVMLDFFVEWEGSAGWVVDQWADSHTLSGLALYYEAVAKQCKDNPVIFSYLIADEPRMAWVTCGMQKAWGDWARRKHRSRCFGTGVSRDNPSTSLRAAWADYPLSGESWASVKVPEDKPAPDSQRLYDYQCFREDLAVRYVKTLSAAIRRVDKNHLISVSNVQWAAPFRFPGMEEYLGRPSSYTAFAPHKIGPYLDYLQINCYNWWDGRTPELAQALGRFSYYPGKPLLMGEYSFEPEVVERNAASYSGFQCWALYPLPSEPTLHYLFDKDGNRTRHAEAFADTAARVRSGRIAFERKPDKDAITVDMRRAVCEPAYGIQLYKDYIDKSSDGRIVGVEVIR
jgi:hypothetical protein